MDLDPQREQDRKVSDSRKPIDPALDLLVYLPVGIAISVAEEVPKLAAKGRQRVNGQLNMAKVVGRFAVAQGRKLVESKLAPPSAPARPSSPPEPAGDLRHEASPFNDRSGTPQASFEAELAGDPPDQGPRSRPEPGQGAPGDVSGLAIPGYDSLSASQVVARLPGLSPQELEAVARYEAAHRARRTILNRAAALGGQAHP